MGEMDDILKEFLVETGESLDQLDQDFVALEKDPEDTERIASIFRAVHTVKGTCSFLGFAKLEKMAHVAENLLSKLRDKKLKLDSVITDTLLLTIDSIREMLSVIEQTGNDGDNDYSELVENLTLLQQGKEIKNVIKKETEEVELKEEKGDLAEVKESKKNLSSANKDISKSSSAIESTIRVDVELLDRLMNLVGELVLSRNQVLQINNHIENTVFSAAVQHLDLITTDLQERVMKTRMQPIGNAWSKFPRVVRDLANSCNKKVRLVMEGKDTELDKSLIEAVRDPLTHMVRNSVDHGIEDVEARVSNSKPEEGTIILRAYHESGHVIVEIEDDGAGIDKNKIIKKALEKGLISESEAESIGDKEAMALMFLPGFSTAEKVTNVSGRGVGMDVVKTNIENVGGSVEVQSEVGKGSTFKVRIPLTLAIIPALIIKTKNNRYAIPQMSVLELLHLENNSSKNFIEVVGGTLVYRLRGKLLPLISLQSILDSKNFNEIEDYNRSINIVVLQANEQQFGLIVDEIQDSQEIVVKPLSSLLNDLRVFAGATILGDGKVSLILDVSELGERCGINLKKENHLQNTHENQKLSSSDLHRLLVCSSPDNTHLAISLSQVTRLERLERSKIESIGDKLLIQYRGDIMHLVDVAGTITRGMYQTLDLLSEEDKLVDVIVYTVRGRSIGLIVKSISDIVETDLKVQGKPSRDGVMCTVPLGKEVIEVIDINKVIKLSSPDFFKRKKI